MPAERPAGRRTCLYDSRQLETTLDGMARQAAGLLTARQEAVLVGIRRRGVPLAEMLRARLAASFGFPRLPLLELAIKRYADDLTLIHPETQLVEDPAHASLDLQAKTLVIVDDVMYSGHSMLRAVDYFAHLLGDRRPAEIRTVVLVDRDVARLPVRTDVVGVRLDVAPGDVIECNVPPYEAELRIELLQPHR
jgi:pyrimidine operon attenuation protein/uracil phosphoribosyltransferase